MHVYEFLTHSSYLYFFKAHYFYYAARFNSFPCSILFFIAPCQEIDFFLDSFSAPTACLPHAQ